MSRRVLVTGGATGIGAAIVRDLVAVGYDVDFTYNKSATEAAALAPSGKREGCPAVNAIRCDLSDPDQVARLCERLESEAPSYYALVYNAGTTADSLGATVALPTAQRLMQVNFWSFVQIVKALLPPMQRSKEGRVLVTSSIAARCGWRGNAVYAASKAALEAYCRCLVDEVARKGVTINSLAPGVIATKMVDGDFFEASREALTRRIPARRYGKADEVARVARLALDPANGYLNGATIAIDGGLSATVGLP